MDHCTGDKIFFFNDKNLLNVPKKLAQRLASKHSATIQIPKFRANATGTVFWSSREALVLFSECCWHSLVYILSSTMNLMGFFFTPHCFFWKLSLLSMLTFLSIWFRCSQVVLSPLWPMPFCLLWIFLQEVLLTENGENAFKVQLGGILRINSLLGLMWKWFSNELTYKPSTLWCYCWTKVENCCLQQSFPSQPRWLSNNVFANLII